MVVVFGLAALIGLYLISVAGWPILALGAAAIIAALLYSGGPLPYGYYGLGELFVFLFFGLAAVVGTYYVQALTLTNQVWLAAVPVGALITGVLVVNNYRDRATDAQANKRTLAVLLGERGARTEYIALLALAYIATALLALDSLWLLLPFASLPLAWRLVQDIRTKTGRALNQTLAGTARLSLIYSILLSIGLFLASL
jgi:1,4-dihydroxy-2-naphthoate octaprenyltransferase